MDAFTENILIRARERQRLLETYGKESTPLRENKTAVSEPNLIEVQKIPPKEVRSETNLSRISPRTEFDVQGSPGKQTKTLNIQRDDFNMEIKVNSAENVRLQVEIEECEEGKEDECVGLREESRNRLNRLGRLYAGGEEADISSPIHRTEAKFYQSIENDKENENIRTKKTGQCGKGLSKLANLADTINQWEDDLSHPSCAVGKKPNSPKKTWKPPAPQPPTQQVSSKKPKAPSPPTNNQTSPKKTVYQMENPSTNEAISSQRGTEAKNSPQSSPKKALYQRENSNNSPQSSPKKALYQRENTYTKETNSSPKKGGFEGNPKQINWDKKVLDTLEEKQLKTSQKIPEEVEIQTPKSPNKFRSGAISNRAAMFEQNATEVVAAKPTKDPALLSLAERKALFEKNKGEALIPKAAFGMSAPVKVDTTMKACESKFIGATKPKENLIQAHKNLFEATKPQKKEDTSVKSKKNPVPVPQMAELKVITPSSPKFVAKSSNVPTVAVVHQGGSIASKMAALMENRNKSTISEEQIANKAKEERAKEIDMLLNRFNKNKETSKHDEIEEAPESDYQSESDEEVDEKAAMLKGKHVSIVDTWKQRKSAEKRKSGNRLSTDSDSHKVVSVLEEVKRIKVSPPKPGLIYPNLSDIEATTTDQETRTPSPNEENSYEDNHYESDDPNTSFGRDIMQAVCKNITPTRKVCFKETASSSENSSVMDELDEILEEMDDDSSTGPTPPKHGRHVSPKHTKPQPSNSFHYKSFNSSSSSSSASTQKSSNFQSPNKSIISPRQSTDLPVVVDGENVMSLTHTVSFYRKQQNEVHTPVRQIVRQPIIEEAPETDQVNNEEVEEKIKQLKEEVNRQQNIISQTSQALNLCSSTPEFFGSTEQVEAERVLLVATHRRQSALHELQRLKIEGTPRPLSDHSQNVPLEKGTLTLSNIVLPMKQKYVTALAAAGGKGHHVVCLIKCQEQVVATKLVSTVASNSKNPDVDLYVPGTVTLNNIHSDFTVTFEVYCLQAQEECLPHEVKYHINKKSSKGLTPKKNKQDSRLVKPPKESPGGPNAVRTSSFALMGYVVFSVQAVNKKVWTLNNTPSMSPLEGNVEMKIQCELAVSVEHKAFLTMFEDVSGFGAWHRRWCLLKGDSMSYWKYPEDEKKTAPIDTIDLKNCITKQVGPVSREICARQHTFLLERERPAYPKDKDTLVMVRKGDKTIIRHLLSADTKEERIEWCQKLNAALGALKMWGNNQQ
ncbi:unnamed protein product [Ceutorhynchus assimilis]|uniref:PH domain-containing protein n=1 Tax=Ceutorhynchus assimilis TaxID=467358 RepID=A0A9P0DJN5_9CUCU|nr:unnamed protein product [Ceutorhynchus assimilis]